MRSPSGKTSKPILVLGLMSGTSADGIDVALARISGTPPRLNARLENFVTMPFSAEVRAAILRIANGVPTTTGEISQLNFLLGELFARAALDACKKFRVRPSQISLVGSHGQTMYHQGAAGSFLDAPRVASTLQIGEPAVIAARTGVTTIGDFRPADMAAGGQGAPLVPFVDYLLYRDARRGRVALNIGGIANVTVIPAGATAKKVFAFDTGPGNMLIDALVQDFTDGKLSYDRDAEMAQNGLLIPALLRDLLEDPFLRKRPPKSAGREQYGEPAAQRLLDWARTYKARPEDLLRTATMLTAVSIVESLHRFVLRRHQIHQLIISGGGAHNPLIRSQLESGLPGISIVPSAALGVPEDAKEAFAFAILAYETWHARPGNLPSATGAKRPAILGKICHAPPK
ncbi:MAG TPA: anhydro-N-acetylmuramic acid kinase [Candidatus Acidoferrales bacterium]|nr:anhydro-N-acetylmuramic acid kinase [Candidatus Acidoferrales bacterium]